MRHVTAFRNEPHISGVSAEGSQNVSGIECQNINPCLPACLPVSVGQYSSSSLRSSLSVMFCLPFRRSLTLLIRKEEERGGISVDFFDLMVKYISNQRTN